MTQRNKRDRKALRFQRDLLRWARRNLRKYPWRESHRSLYDVFIAEFFMTQTPAGNVAAVYPRFISRYPSLAAIRHSSSTDLARAIEPLGLQNRRALALKEIASELDDLPTDTNQLAELERVGPYVSNATLCFALGRRLPVVDRNVKRVYGRLYGSDWPQLKVDQDRFAFDVLPENRVRLYNLALLDFGALLCRKTPLCGSCFASEYCHYAAGPCPAESKADQPG